MSIGGRGIDEWGEYHVGTIWEGIRIFKHIAKKVSKVKLQAKEYINKDKAKALTETAAMKVEVQSTIVLVKKIDQF